MKLYRAEEAPVMRGATEFRESRRAALVFGGVFLGAVATALALGIPAIQSVDSILEVAFVLVITPLALVLASCGLLMVADFAASCRRSNWLLRHDGSGFLIHFRSFQNAHLPTDAPTVAWIPASDVDHIRRVTRRFDRPSGDSTVRVREVAIELCLKPGVSTEPLRDALADEAGLPPSGRFIRRRSRHVPVSVPEPGVVRLPWLDSGHHIRPGAKRAFEEFGRHHAVTASPEREIPFASLDEDEFLEELSKLVESGSTLTAITLVRERYVMSLTDARQLVGNLPS